MFVRLSAWPHEELLYKEWQKQPTLSRNAATGGAKPPTPGPACRSPISFHLALAVHSELCASYLPTLPNNPRFLSRLPT